MLAQLTLPVFIYIALLIAPFYLVPHIAPPYVELSPYGTQRPLPSAYELVPMRHAEYRYCIYPNWLVRKTNEYQRI